MPFIAAILAHMREESNQIWIGYEKRVDDSWHWVDNSRPTFENFAPGSDYVSSMKHTITMVYINYKYI